MTDRPLHEEVVEWLYMLKWLPDLLPPAPDPHTPEHLALRSIGGHPCAKCSGRARIAIVAETDKGHRWLDLCPECHSWISQGLGQIDSW